jgi:hypothetical protein
MTEFQKQIFKKLLNGSRIVRHPAQIRVQDSEASPEAIIGERSFHKLKRFLRKTKAGFFILDRKKVRSQHGNSSEKKLYKKWLKQQE